MSKPDQTLSPRTLATDDIADAVALILPENGYNTSIGATVVIAGAEYQPNEGEPPCVVIVPGTSSPADAAAGGSEIDYIVRGFVNRRLASVTLHDTNPDAEYVIVDGILNDLAYALDNLRCPSSAIIDLFQGSAEPIYSNEGGEVIGGTILCSVVTPFIDTFSGA